MPENENTTSKSRRAPSSATIWTIVIVLVLVSVVALVAMMIPAIIAIA